MKNTLFVSTALHFAVLIVALTSVVAEENTAELHYKWRQRVVLEYRRSLLPEADSVGSNTLQVIVLSGSNDVFTVAVRCPDFQPHSTLFVQTDIHGKSQWRRILSSSPDLNRAVGQPRGDTELWELLSPLEWFDQHMWQLPQAGLTNGVPLVENDKSYRLISDDSLGMGTVVVFATVTAPNVVGKSHQILRSFDRKRGMLVESRPESGHGVWLRLVAESSIGEDQLRQFIDECNRAQDEDEYRFQVCMAYLNASNRVEKTRAYLAMYPINRPDLSIRTYMKMTASAGVDAKFTSLAELYLFKRLAEGQSWARDAMMAHPWAEIDANTLALRVANLERMSGTSFGISQNQWREWCDSINRALPNWNFSSGQELKKAVRDLDPFVRLFALRELLDRADSNVSSLIGEALHDDDARIRAFAKNRHYPHSIRR